jgi:hypothetical protein
LRTGRPLWPLHFKDLTTGTSTNKNDWPKYEEKAPVIHEENLLEKMLAASTTDEADLLHFFLETGFRNGETAPSEYSDITWGNLVLEAPGIKSHSIRRPGRRAILSLIL